MWHVKCDMWHVTRDTWYVTHDSWGELNLLWKFLDPSFNCLGFMMFMWHKTCDIWQETGDIWHVTIWHMTGGGKWTFSDNLRSLALTIWGLWWFKYWEGKDDWLTDWMNEWMNEWMSIEGDHRTAPATRGLLNIIRKKKAFHQPKELIE